MQLNSFSFNGSGSVKAPFLIAEMACAHEGEVSRAKQLIDAAAKAGADAIQLQVFSRESQVAPSHRLYDLLETLEFSGDDWAEIFAHAHNSSLKVFCFAYDVQSLELALKLGVDGIKLSSSDLAHPEMLKRSAQSNKWVTLGTGASTLDEITAALNVYQQAGGHKAILMHGVQNFPTALENANISRIKLLQSVFGLPVGYQDHTDASLDISHSIDLVALGMGAQMLEKHVTLDRSEQGTDYQAALEPAELNAYVHTMRQAASALGVTQPTKLTDSDVRYRLFQKKKILTRYDVSSGEALTSENTIALRSEMGEGISPLHFEELKNNVLARNLKAYSLVSEADFAG